MRKIRIRRDMEGRKALGDFYFLLLIVLLVAVIVLVGSIVSQYFSSVYEVVNIQTKMNIFMANDDAGTELVALLNSKTGDVKNIEMLGRYSTDGISEEKDRYMEYVKGTLASFLNYQFSLSGLRTVSYSSNAPASIQNPTKLAIQGCGVSVSEKIVMDWPLDPSSNVIKSGFGGRDLSKDFGKTGCDCHGGIDIGSERGKPVYAAAAGIVSDIYPKTGQKLCVEYLGTDKKLKEEALNCNRGYGNFVVIEHPAGTLGTAKYYTHYAHLATVSVNIGDPVTKGKVIGTVGNTGYSSGPHLHFELRDSTDKGDTNSINPCMFFPTSMPESRMGGSKCEHEQVSVCTYVSGPSVRSYETDIPLPGAKSGTARGIIIFKRWD